MRHPFVILLKLYGPVVAFAALLPLTVAVSARGTFSLNANLGVLQGQLPIENVWFARALVVASAFVPLLAYLSYDFTRFFEEKFNVEIYFDEPGTVRRLREFSHAEQRELGIIAESHRWADLRRQYFEMLDRDFVRLTSGMGVVSGDAFYAMKEGRVHCAGDAFFKARKVRWGLQRYQIESARGEVEQILERPLHPAIRFKSYFELDASPADNIRASLKDIYVRRQLVIAPVFHQIWGGHKDAFTQQFHHRLVAATKLTFFPYPEFSDSVYLYETPEGMLPVGYAVYS